MTDRENPEPAAAPVAALHAGNTVRASWPFSLHQIRANIAHCSPEGKEAVVSAFLWCTDAKHPVELKTFCSRVGYSANTLYKILSGKYRHPETDAQLDVPKDLAVSIRQFMALEKERFLGGRNEFVLTPTAKRIFTFVDLVRESQSPGFITGPSHSGKTMALERYQNDNNHGRTVYIRIKAASGLGGMVRRIAERVGVAPNANTSDLIDRIKRALTPDMVLIFDEVHQLTYTYRRASFFACIEVIREIHDEVGCGMVLCGTTLLLTALNEGAQGEMEQMLRRGVHRLNLAKAVPKSDIAPILSHWGLEFPKASLEIEVRGVTERPYDVLRQLAAKSGLKAICERLRYARKLAAKQQDKISWDYFLLAHLTIAKQAIAEEEWD